MFLSGRDQRVRYQPSPSSGSGAEASATVQKKTIAGGEHEERDRSAAVIQPQTHSARHRYFLRCFAEPESPDRTNHLLADDVSGSRVMKTVLSMLVALGTFAEPRELRKRPTA